MEHKTLENFGLDLKIASYEEMSLSDGHNAFIIYLIIENKTSSSRKVNVSKATYITNKKEQLEQDNWLSGYLITEDTIYPNSFKKAGLVFYKSKLKKISDDDTIKIIIELPFEGVEVEFSFIKTGNYWKKLESKKREKEVKLNPTQLVKSLLNKIERFEAFEERLNVRFENVSVKVIDSRKLHVMFELHSNIGTTLHQNIRLECVAYDVDGKILGIETSYSLKEIFFGFQVFDFVFYPHDWGDNFIDKISKLRLYPKIME